MREFIKKQVSGNLYQKPSEVSNQNINKFLVRVTLGYCFHMFVFTGRTIRHNARSLLTLMFHMLVSIGRTNRHGNQSFVNLDFYNVCV